MDPYGSATPCFFHDSFSYLLVSTYGWGVYAFSFFFFFKGAELYD